MTDIFEGSVIRSSRRLDEFLNQVICEIFFLKHHLLSLCYFSPKRKLSCGSSGGPHTIFSKIVSTKSQYALWIYPSCPGWLSLEHGNNKSLLLQLFIYILNHLHK
jgi:hypothetical protein